jgi:hypothetical protein
MRPRQLAKAPAISSEMLGGSSSFANPELAKAEGPILVNVSGKEIEVRLEHPHKDREPILDSLGGSVTLTSVLQPSTMLSFRKTRLVELKSILLSISEY